MARVDTHQRLRFVSVTVVSLFMALLARSWYLQVIISDEATAQATANATRVITIPAPRGEILDVKGRVLVENRVTTVVAINPNEIDDILPNRLDRLEMFTKLAIAINRSADLVKADEIESAYENSSYSPYDDVPIAYDVSEDLLVYVNEHSAEFPGVTVREATVRSYPFGELGAHLLGWVGSINRDEWQARQDHPKNYELRDEIGKAGIEQMFEEDLRGYPGTRVVEVDKDGNILRERTDLFIAPIPGNDVRLTIDIDVQSVAERELAQAIRIARSQRPEDGGPAYDAPGGSVVMLNPENGDVLAMASYPTYDPNDAIGGFSPAQYSQLTDPDNDFPLLNRSVQGEYPPGSTFKPITAIAALREGVFGQYIPFLPDQPQSDPGTYTLRSCLFTGDDQEDEQELAGCVFNNANKRRHSGVDLPRSLTVSSDWYYYQLGEAIWAQPEVNHNAIQDVASEFGFGERTGIQMPSTGERRGRVPSQQQREELAEASPGAVLTTDWFTGDNVNLAIGQGDMLATPLQMAVMYSVLANGGTRFAPNLVAEVDRTDRDGSVVTVDFAPRVLGRVELPPEYLDPIMAGLLGVTTVGPSSTEEGGTAYAAFHDQTPGGVAFPLADFPVAGKTGTAQKVSGSDTDADYSLFIGFGPVPDSRYVVAAVIEEAGFGSQVAAPLVARILDPIARGNLPAALPQEIRFARFVARTACLQWQGALAVDDGDDSTTTTSTTRPTNTLPLDPLLPEPPSVDENGVALVDDVAVKCTDVLADIAAEEQALAEAEDARGDDEVAD